jgi:hypothetical protein
MLYSLFNVEPKPGSGRLGLVSYVCGTVCWGSGASFPAIFVRVRSATVVLCWSYFGKAILCRGKSKPILSYQWVSGWDEIGVYIRYIHFIAMLCTCLWLVKQFGLSTDFFISYAICNNIQRHLWRVLFICILCENLFLGGSTCVQLFWLNRVEGLRFFCTTWMLPCCSSVLCWVSMSPSQEREFMLG